MVILALAIGAVIGMSLGALGGGGSILTVPALVYVLGQTPHAATTGSLLIVGITSLAGAVAHFRAGRVRIGAGAAFGLLGVAGSYVGSRLSAGVRPDLLLAGFAVLMLVAAAAMVRRGRDERPARQASPAAPAAIEEEFARGLPARGAVALVDAGPAPTATATRPARRVSRVALLRLGAAATVVGLLTGFFGVGGGFVIVPALVLALGFSMPEAVGTSLLIIGINSAASLGARLGGHVHLDWTLLAVFTLAAVAGSVAGNRVASKVDSAVLARAFTVLLVVVAVYTAARSIPHLA